MKNIRNILAKGVFMLLVSLLAMACTEKSDWGIDASYSRPFGTNEDGINVTKDEKSSSGYGNLGCHARRRILYS